ncbi:DNA polymerase III subunit epsilon [Schaalia sp. ZJ405]|uniref:exonuclease domain-containing protein n=1 Tax=Schaalia sp. ZJ405 TaxID=2709403 RepID=UPI0013EBEA39|nr:exonuclease domain-containing protein [Schaalia sp. ZJ405]QPK80917.1 DNA polymerase III subunit epsilon [Schaalia sp. ZJ405]
MWTQDPWLGFDTETTGISVRSDRIVTAALILRIGGAQPVGPDQERTWLADPGVEIPAQATAVHGITTEHARTHGRPIDEVLEQVTAALVTHWTKGFPVVAFNGSYDVSILDAELRRHGLASLAQRLNGAPMLLIDPLVLDRSVDRYRKGKRTLTSMAPVYGVRASDNAHTAEVDVAMTLDVLAAMVDKHPKLAAMTAEELHSFQVIEHRKWAENFMEFLRRNGKEAHIDPNWPMSEQ